MTQTPDKDPHVQIPEESQRLPAHSFATEADDPEIPNQSSGQPIDPLAVETPEQHPLEEIPFHPLADICPLMMEPELAQLVADIWKNGLVKPIVMYENKILDGRNRYRACLSACVMPRFEDYGGDDPVGYVISHNVLRRQMNESQRAAAATMHESVTHGGDRRSDQDAKSHLGRAQLAEKFNVSERSIASAKRVRVELPALFPLARRGQLAVSFAEKATRLPPNKKQEIAEMAKAGDIEGVRRTINEHRTRFSQEGDKQPLTTEKGDVVVAYFEKLFEEATKEAACKKKLSEASKLKIIEKRVASVAADGCLMFVWTTPVRLAQTLNAISSWGFQYRDVWAKDSAEGGSWHRLEHELLLVAQRGNAPEPAQSWPSIVSVPVSEGSTNFATFLELIGQSFPTARIIELCSVETTRSGWVADW
jgi:N6-adenosine-specific RNA methylase IME4